MSVSTYEIFVILKPPRTDSAFLGIPVRNFASLPENCTSRRPSGLRKTKHSTNSLAHRTTWLRSDLWPSPSLKISANVSIDIWDICYPKTTKNRQCFSWNTREEFRLTAGKLHSSNLIIARWTFSLPPRQGCQPRHTGMTIRFSNYMRWPSLQVATGDSPTLLQPKFIEILNTVHHHPITWFCHWICIFFW